MASQKGRNNSSAGRTRKSASPEEKDKLQMKEQLTREELMRKRAIHDEIIAIILIAISIFLIVSLQTSATGAVGQFVQTLFFGLFGRVSYALPYFLIAYSILIFTKKSAFVTIRSWLSIIALIVMASALNASFYQRPQADSFFETVKALYALGANNGGVVGSALASWLTDLIGKAGLYIVCIAGIIITLLFIINTPLSTLFDNIKLKGQAAAQAYEERRLELEMENQKKETEARVKADIAAREAARAELLKAEEAEKSTSDKESGAESESESKAAEETLPKLNLGALTQLEFTSLQHEEKTKDRDTINFTPESIGLTSSQPAPKQEPESFPDSEFSSRQKRILTYVKDDETYGVLDSDSSRLGLTGIDSPASLPGGSVKQPKTSTGISAAGTEPTHNYVFPPITLLKKPVAGKEAKAGELTETARVLEATLRSFGVNANVIDAVRGPAVTRFEVQPASGVKVSSITRLQDDIALNLRAKSLRIEAPIPGKAAVGIEVSNSIVNTVFLREILESDAFKKAESKISVGLGHTISGESIVANLKDMPHLLIAGATGSGKSVCINSIIISLLFKASPDEVKLILVDPKVVELSFYNGIPHLLSPVVTEPSKASAALGWAVSEMNERYKRFAEAGVRDLESYNDVCRGEDETEKVLPQIVIIIDELADLIMAAQNQVEDSICRLAQKARGAGMHLIVATQRPSVDVITGVIKANIPSRIAFAVSSQVDSRTILDGSGAEKLLGKGDMLYHPQGMSKPVRVQGCFVSYAEVKNIIEFVKQNNAPKSYSQDLIDTVKNAGAGSSSKNESEDVDELLTDAIECVVRSERASTSMLQRRFRIGYNRAARLMDMMEERGIIGPADGSNARKVNMSISRFEQLEAEVREAEAFPGEDPEFKDDIV